MSRNSQLFTSYLQAAIFMVLGLRCVMAWTRQKDPRSAHLAIAAGLFGLSSLLSAITNTIYDSTKIPPEIAPRWESIVSAILIYVSIYFFLVFLSDFIPFPRWLHALLILATTGNIVLAIIEQPDLRFDPKLGLVKIPGVDNPIEYRTYIGYVLVYLAVAFGVLAVAFLVYGFRTGGLPRFRMLTIGFGFLLICVAIGLLPRLLFGHPTAATIKHLSNALTYIVLVSGPLLLIGFSPPKFVRERFPEGAAQATP